LVVAVTALSERHPVVVCADDRLPAELGRCAHVETPIDYVGFLSLQAGAGAVITDSSGVQEETSVLRVPCYTLARASERALTLTHGTNSLLGEDVGAIADVTLTPSADIVDPIPLWDGEAGRRVGADLADAPWRST
jgi:UDP-N-acetylglucosamine 2-epimerase (non-hydrolysing)